MRAGGTPASGTITDQLMTLGGGGALAGVGDFISSYRQTVPTQNLNEPYLFYIEVPPGASTLQVDIFDADTLQGGAADITGERDQNRDLNGAVNTKTRFQLFDPDGNLAASRFSYSDNVVPLLSDNAWLRMYDNTTDGISGGDTFADNFGTNAYTNDDGNQTFTTAWIESNDLGGAGATAGDVQVLSGELRLGNQSAGAPFTNQPSVAREMNLSTYTAAELSFDWRTGAGVDIISAGSDSGDSIAVEMSSNGGTTYVVIDEFAGLSGVQSGAAVYDVTPFISVNTRVRLRITNRYAGTNEFFFVDNFQVRGTTTANGGSPAAGHWQLRVDTSGDVNGQIAGIRTRTQDDVNAFGLRAHDGTPGAGGTEYNVYAHSYIIVGINNNDRSRDYDHFPYVTRGCTATANDFDFDASQPNPPAPNTNTQPFGSLQLTSRSGSFVHNNATMSNNDAWNGQTVSSWTDDDEADDYGIWSMDSTIADWNLNNYGPIYLGNDLAAAAPPTSSPEANTFRIYFPNDAGNAPAKPYLSQYLTYVDEASSGGNPPSVGQTSRYAVSLVITNPTGSIGDITLSATDVVTGHVPSDTQSTYEGVAFVTAGTVVSQPAIGATTGDVTWNPGTLSPGDSETLVYFVDVTPTAVGSYPVTGAAGTGNGTRATWIDETGDQTFTFGELCRLQVSSAPATPVLVSSFESFEVDGQVLVQWQTAAEAETVALDLYRYVGAENGPSGASPASASSASASSATDWQRVNRAPLPALLGRNQGGVYRLVDPEADGSRAQSYYLVEHEADGEQRTHGPFHTTPVRRADLSLPTASGDPAARNADPGFERWPHPGLLADDRAGQPRSSDLESAQRVAVSDLGANLGADGRLRPLGTRAPVAAGTGWRLSVPAAEVGEAALVRATAADLATALGVDLPLIQRLLARQGLDITQGGQRVAWRALPHGQGLELLGADPATPFTDRQVFQVAIQPGLAMAPERGTLPPADWDGETHRRTVRAEQGVFGVVLMDLDPASDTWFWDFVSQHASHGSKRFPLSLAAPITLPGADDARLRVQVQGATPGEHRLAVRWNGVDVGEIELDDLAAASAEIALPATSLLDGSNEVEIVSLEGGTVFVDAFELDYERPNRAIDGRLRLHAQGHRTLTAWGFADADVRVLDIADPLRPRPVAARVVSEADGYRAIWQAESEGPYLAVDGSGTSRPQIKRDAPSSLRDPSRAADYLVITTGELLTAAEELASYRAGQGWTTAVVDLDDVYDEWSYGRVDPRALRDFLAYARSSWSVPPRYVVLAGSGTYDYRDHLGFGTDPVPALQASNGSSLFASDSAYAPRDEAGLPTLLVGRIPVRTAAELANYVDKVVAYETGPAGASNRVHLLADASDGILDFPAENARLAGLLGPGWELVRADLDESSLATARADLAAAFDAGLGWLHYTGHGGVDRMSSQGLLVSDDIAELDNADAFPIVSSVTCHIGLHALPGYDALGEHLVGAADEGAVAVFAPTWLVPHAEARFVGDRLLRRAFDPSADPAAELLLGDAISGALSDAAAMGVDRSVLDTYQLLGDPALRLRLEPATDDADTCEPNCSGPG